MPDLPKAPSSRRSFLITALGSIGAALAAAIGWPLWRFLAPSAGPGKLERVSIARSQVPPGSAHFFQFRGRPAVLLQTEAGEFTALSAVCTHLGCIVQWKEAQKEFLCPCHAGRFAPDGRVLGGPPPRPLEKLTVSVSGDTLLVG